MSRDQKALEQSLLAHLRGYGQHNADGLAAVATYGEWPLLAEREGECRMATILEALPQDAVFAIARREINLNALACQVLTELNTDNAMAMLKLSDAAKEAVEDIARQKLDVQSLDRQHVRHLNFYEIPVWKLREALEAAYLAGMVDHHRNR